MRVGLAIAVVVAVAGAVAQVPAVKNPSGVTFTSPDHETVTGYEVDVLSGTSVLTTLVLGKGTQAVDGVVTLPLNVQPIAFGTYTLRIRAVASPVLKSANSPASDPWERVPGAPSKGSVQ